MMDAQESKNLNTRTRKEIFTRNNLVFSVRRLISIKHTLLIHQKFSIRR